MRKISKAKVVLTAIILFCALGITGKHVAAAETKTIKPKLIYNLRGLYPHVVQRAVVGPKFVYTVQIYGKDSIIKRARRPRRSKNVNFGRRDNIRLKNFGHTQTLVYSGKSNWFVGCTPIKEKAKAKTWYWDTEIARIHFPNRGSVTYKNAKKLPRLTQLKYATDMPQDEFPGVKRSEAAISPNHKLLLIALLDKQNNGHFAIYSLKEANQKLDRAAKKRNKAVSLKSLHQISAFHINKLMGVDPTTSLKSIQGYDIANDKTIYISNEEPTYKLGHSIMPREIVKINWGDTNPNNWLHYNLNLPSWKHDATELEGLELAGPKIRQVVSFHFVKNKKNHHRETINGIYLLNGITG